MRVLGFNERGVPEPPADLVARLSAYSPQLQARCFRWGIEDQWAVVWVWNEDDPRMARVRDGEIDPATAVDIIAYVPLDVRPDDLAAYIEPMLRSLSAPGMHGYASDLLATVQASNAAHSDEVWKPTMERAEEAIDANKTTLFRQELGTIPKVFQHNPPTTRKKKKS